jgi:hypothetical protein
MAPEDAVMRRAIRRLIGADQHHAGNLFREMARRRRAGKAASDDDVLKLRGHENSGNSTRSLMEQMPASRQWP